MKKIEDNDKEDIKGLHMMSDDELSNIAGAGDWDLDDACLMWATRVDRSRLRLQNQTDEWKMRYLDKWFCGITQFFAKMGLNSITEIDNYVYSDPNNVKRNEHYQKSFHYGKYSRH